MAVTVAIESIVNNDPSGGLDATQNEIIVDGTLTLTGNYGDLSPANGDILDLTGFDLIKSQKSLARWIFSRHRMQATHPYSIRSCTDGVRINRTAC